MTPEWSYRYKPLSNLKHLVSSMSVPACVPTCIWTHGHAREGGCELGEHPREEKGGRANVCPGPGLGCSTQRDMPALVIPGTRGKLGSCVKDTPKPAPHPCSLGRWAGRGSACPCLWAILSLTDIYPPASGPGNVMAVFLGLSLQLHNFLLLWFL